MKNLNRKERFKKIKKDIRELRDSSDLRGKQLVTMRVNRLVWESFKNQCALGGLSASEVLRRFIGDYTK